MRTLEKIVEAHQKNKPFKGKNFLVCTHFKQTAIGLIRTIQALGGLVYYHPISYSSDNSVLDSLKRNKKIIFLKDDSQLASNLRKIDIIIEDGARLSKIILGSNRKIKLRKNLFSIEQTTHGFLFWSSVSKDKIPYPVISVSNTQIKTHIENNRATPESLLGEFLRATGVALTGKSALILGFGMIGSGLARLLREYGVSVSVVEVYPVRRLISSSMGFLTYEPDQINKVLPEQDIIISCTNSYGGSSLGVEQFLLMKDGAIIFNGGSGRGEIEEEMLSPRMYLKNHANISIQRHADDVHVSLEKMGCSKKLTILSGGHPINLRRGNGTSSDVIDFVFSLMVLAAIRTDCKKLSKRVYHLDPAVENEMALLCETGGVSKQWIPTHLKKSQLKFDKRPYGGVFKFGNQVMERFSLARAVFTPGSETEGHYHLNSEEAYLIENGAANMTVWHYQHPENKTVYPVKAGDYFTIPRGFVHHVKVTSSTDFICLVVASPPFSFWDQFFETKGK